MNYCKLLTRVNDFNMLTLQLGQILISIYYLQLAIPQIQSEIVHLSLPLIPQLPTLISLFYPLDLHPKASLHSIQENASKVQVKVVLTHDWFSDAVEPSSSSKSSISCLYKTRCVIRSSVPQQCSHLTFFTVNLFNLSFLSLILIFPLSISSV